MKKVMLTVMLFAALLCLPAYGQNCEAVCATVIPDPSCSTDPATSEAFEEILKMGGVIPTKKYATARVNIRQEPDMDSIILGTCNMNTEFEVVLEINGWSMVAAEGGYAYMKSDWFEDGPAKKSSSQPVYLGRFRITHYCECRKCNGKWAGGPTESGRMPQVNRTIAVDKNQIPLGSRIMINGQIYTAEDTGSAIKSNCIDIFVGSHQEALRLGVYDTEVYLLQ